MYRFSSEILERILFHYCRFLREKVGSYQKRNLDFVYFFLFFTVLLIRMLQKMTET